MSFNFNVSTVLLIVSIVIFAIAAINLQTFSTTSDIELVAAGLAFFAASFLPRRS